jgi:tryptophan synthase beta chain
MTKAPFVYDFGDTAATTPLLPMHSLGHAFIPAPIHAGGLRYHGLAPLVSQLIIEGLIEPRAYNQLECYAAAVLWARTEGFIPAPETSHAIQVVIEEAKKAKEEGKEKVILLNWSGHGLMDLGGYDSYFSGKLVDYPLPEDEMKKSLKSIEGLPKAPKMKKGKPV